MKTTQYVKILVAALVFACFVQGVFADDITNGIFVISGTIYITNAQSTPVVTAAGTCAANVSCIFWQDGLGTTNGKIDISASGLPNGDIPAAIAGNDAANIASLLNPPDAVGTAISVPFMTFNNGGVTSTLTLTKIFPGLYTSTECTAPPAVGQTCTPPGSMFNFVNNPPIFGRALMTWEFEGITGTPGVTWAGGFTSQFPANTPYQTVFANLATNGFVADTFSATIVLAGSPTPAPEPGTISLFTFGIGSLLLLRRVTQLRPLGFS
jgi:hypothetical protein